jgi:CAAX protease family protein
MNANQAASRLRHQADPVHPASGIAAFLVIAFGFAWAIWLPMWLLGVPSGSAPAQVAQVVGSFGPAVAAVVVRRWVTREGFADAGLRPRLRQAAPYYLFAWLFPIPFLAAAATLAAASGVSVHWSDFGAVLGALATALALTPVIFGEEFGWRSYLQPRLLAGRPLLGAITVGAIWGTWHVPAVLLGLEPHQHGAWSIALFPWFMIPFSIILGWLWQRTGTVWVPALAHSSVNVALAAGGGMLAISGGYGDLWYSRQGIIASLIFIAFAAWIALTGRVGHASAQSPGPQPPSRGEVNHRRAPIAETTRHFTHRHSRTV